MSIVSPLKQNLLQLEFTPAKINSWNQTSQKQQPRNIKRRCNSKTTNYLKQPKFQANQLTNLASLREKRLKLLESSTKKKNLSEQILTKSFKSFPKSAQISNPQKSNNSEFLQKSNEFKLKLTEVKVSEFKYEDTFLRPAQIKYRPKPNHLPALPPKNPQQLKSTLQRLRGIQNKLIINPSNKLTVSIPSGQESHRPINQNLKNLIFKTRRIVPVNQKVEIQSLQ